MIYFNDGSSISYEVILNILDNVSGPIAVYDQDTRLIMVNEKVKDYWQLNINEYMGKTTADHVKAGLIGNSIIARTIACKEELCEVVHTSRGNVISRCRPILDEKGTVKLIVSTISPADELDELQAKLAREQYENDKYKREIEHLRNTLLHNEDLVYESKDMNDLLQIVGKVAPIDCNVLITGESGVGKEVLAKTIHLNSNRNKGPFVAVNIAAIPETLLEAELFGYEEGSFTGAIKGGKIGLFEVAQKGTLFLDEVGDMPHTTQVKLLRAIETGEIMRVGGNKPIQMDARIVSATNKDLNQAVEKKDFREDLYYRLNVFPLKIKPLRERRDDIIPLVQHFVTKCNQKFKLKKAFDNSAMQLLNHYAWPGNVRELKNVVERVSILSNNDLITAVDIQSALDIDGHQRTIPAVTKINPSIWNEYETYEKQQILEALRVCEGNKTKAAQYLGMTRSKLYRKIKNCHLE